MPQVGRTSDGSSFEITLHDPSGVVARLIPINAPALSATATEEAIRETPTAYRLSWMTSPCDKNVDMIVQLQRNDVAFTIDPKPPTNMRPTDVCPFLGIVASVQVELNKPLAEGGVATITVAERQ